MDDNWNVNSGSSLIHNEMKTELKNMNITKKYTKQYMRVQNYEDNHNVKSKRITNKNIHVHYICVCVYL